MKKLTIVYILVGVGVCASLIGPLFVKPDLIVSFELIGVCFHLGAAALFLSSLNNFKTLLKIAYTLIAIGYGFGALGALQLPVVAMIGGISSHWVESGLVGIPFLLAMICLYSGDYLAARLFNIRSLAARPYFVIPLGVIAGIMAGITAPGAAFDASAFIYTMLGTIYFCAAWLALTIRGQASKRFGGSLNWLAAAFALAAAPLLQNLLVHLLLPADSWYTHSIFVTLGNVVTAIAAFMAAHSFTKLGINADATFMEQNPSANSVDVVAYVASLVSNPREVDVFLNDIARLVLASSRGRSYRRPTRSDWRKSMSHSKITLLAKTQFKKSRCATYKASSCGAL